MEVRWVNRGDGNGWCRVATDGRRMLIADVDHRDSIADVRDALVDDYYCGREDGRFDVDESTDAMELAALIEDILDPDRKGLRRPMFPDLPADRETGVIVEFVL